MTHSNPTQLDKTLTLGFDDPVVGDVPPSEGELGRCPDRRNGDSVKWNQYGAEVLPLWVADMDIQSPRAVREALAARVAEGVYGYGHEPSALAELIAGRLQRLYNWQVGSSDIVFIPGVMPGANLTCLVTTHPGESVLVQTPVYPPIRRMPGELGRRRIELDFVLASSGRFEIDWDKFEAALADPVRLFVLCNPQNPTGRVFERTELERLAELCLRYRATICSDEIHSDLVHEGHRHVPVASLDSEIAHHTITLMAPSKTYNLAGLGSAFAVIQNQELRAKFRRARGSLVPHVNTLAYVAATAAYSSGERWLTRVRRQLLHHRNLLDEFVRQQLPDVDCIAPEGTYLAWLDCTHVALSKRPFDFFLTEAKVALNDGSLFGANASACVRLNFGCATTTLLEALGRMRDALERHCAAQDNTSSGLGGSGRSSAR